MMYDTELKSKYGIDKLIIMVMIMQIIEGDGGLETKVNHEKFIKFLEKETKRGLTNREHLHLAEGILKYIQSDPQTNEREAAMKYLFNLDFLQ